MEPVVAGRVLAFPELRMVVEVRAGVLLVVVVIVVHELVLGVLLAVELLEGLAHRLGEEQRREDAGQHEEREDLQAGQKKKTKTEEQVSPMR